MTHWVQIPEATFEPGIRFLLKLYGWLGRGAFRLALLPVVFWYFLTTPSAREASRDYLQRLRAASSRTTPTPTVLNQLRHLRSFAESLLDKLLVWGGRIGDLSYTVHGEEAIAAATARGRGAVLITAHVGNFELCQVLASRYTSARVNVLMHIAHSSRFNALLNRSRFAEHICLVPLDRLSAATAATLAERVDKGELIAIAGDRLLAGARTGSISVPFLGVPAAFPIGPYVLASALQCPLIAIFATRRGSTYEISVTELAEQVVLRRGQRQSTLRHLAERFAALLEAECRAAPFQWFNFYPFWLDSGAP